MAIILFYLEYNFIGKSKYAAHLTADQQLSLEDFIRHGKSPVSGTTGVLTHSARPRNVAGYFVTGARIAGLSPGIQQLIKLEAKMTK